MSEPFIAEIRIMGCNFAPRGWAFCHGQLLPISQNTALFSLVGTTYGGDGRTTFGLPDLQGRAPLHPGRGPGLTERQLGQKGGAESITLTQNEMPAHNHLVNVFDSQGLNSGTETSSAGNYYSKGAFNQTINTSMASQAIAATGGNQSHSNLQPALAMTFCIALQGLYPSRS